MKDTDPAIEKIYHKMLMSCTREERLQMTSSMFTTAREIILSSLKERYPEATYSELRGLLFLRLYRDDFSKEEQETIYQHIVNRRVTDNF